MSFRERLHMAWELTWPMALIDVLFVLTFHALLDFQGETADSIWAFVSFFTVSPWVVRRALRMKYGRWHVEPRLTYQQSLKVMWLLMWRSLVLSLAALLVVSLFLRVIGVDSQTIGEQGPLANNLGLSLADALSSLVFFPILIPSMLRKKYRGFHLQAIEDPSS